jgi:hypothetical protein
MSSPPLRWPPLADSRKLFTSFSEDGLVALALVISIGLAPFKILTDCATDFSAIADRLLSLATEPRSPLLEATLAAISDEALKFEPLQLDGGVEDRLVGSVLPTLDRVEAPSSETPTVETLK